MQNGYQETKIGAIPEEWKLEQLGNIGDFFKGKTITKSEITETGFPCIRYGDIYVQYEFANTVTHFSAYIRKETAKIGRRLLKGDIIFAGTGETQEDIGKCVAYTRDEKAFAGGDLIVFRPNKDVGIDSEFLSYCLNTGEVANRKSRLGQGLSIFHIYSSHLQTLEVPLPPLPEQKKITDILSTLDNAIEKTDAIIEETKQLKKGLMQKLFNEGIGHTRFKETKIGRIPEEWQLLKLGQIASFKNGANFPKEDIVDSGTLMVDVLNMYSEGIGMDLNKLYRVEVPLKSKHLLEAGDLLFVRSSLKKEGVGWSALFNGYSEPVAFCGFLIRARLLSNAIYPRFLAYYLIAPKTRGRIISLSGTVTITNIGQEGLGKLSIPIPSIEEQHKIEKIFSEVDSKIEKENAIKKQLEKLKKALMQVLLTGKVRVKV